MRQHWLGETGLRFMLANVSAALSPCGAAQWVCIPALRDWASCREARRTPRGGSCDDGGPHLVGRPIRGVWLAGLQGHGGLPLAWLARLGVRSACPTPDLWMYDLRWALLEPGEL